MPRRLRRDWDANTGRTSSEAMAELSWGAKTRSLELRCYLTRDGVYGPPLQGRWEGRPNPLSPLTDCYPVRVVLCEGPFAPGFPRGPRTTAPVKCAAGPDLCPKSNSGLVERLGANGECSWPYVTSCVISWRFDPVQRTLPVRARPFRVSTTDALFFIIRFRPRFPTWRETTDGTWDA